MGSLIFLQNFACASIMLQVELEQYSYVLKNETFNQQPIWMIPISFKITCI